jgi:hypothetical protein
LEPSILVVVVVVLVTIGATEDKREQVGLEVLVL